MEVQTHRFGVLTVKRDEIITFPHGFLGFPDYKQYVLIEPTDSVFWFLQSVDDPDLAFVLIPPEILRPDYEASVDKAQVADIKLAAPENSLVFSIVTVPQNTAAMTANLQAPLVINKECGLAKQLVLMDGRYQVRHNVLEEIKAAAQKTRRQELAGTLKKSI